MAEEDSVKTEEEQLEEKEENEKETVKEDEEEEKEVEEEESKETEGKKEKKKKEKDEPEQVNAVKEKEKPFKEKKQKQKSEDVPAKEAVTTPINETPEVPLYDQPLEMSGKRDRKKVDRFVQEAKKEELLVTGNGVALGDIPYIDAMISKMALDELKVLHRVAYNRPGSGNEIKKNLRKFNGFPFEEDDKKYQGKLATVERIVMSEIKKMLMVLGLERAGNKGDVVEKLMVFMMHPEDSGKKPPADAKKGKSRGRPSKKPQEEKKQNSTSLDDSRSSGSDSNASASEQENEEEDQEEEEAEEKPKEKPKKTPGRKPAGKKTPGKKTPATKRPPAAKRGKPAPASDDSDSDDEPLAKKVKQPPTDSELKGMVKKILEGANLEEVTMKSVCRQVYESYPDFDLAHKKLFIKETVKSIIS